MSKEYKKSTRDIVSRAKAWAKKRKDEGWTRKDFLDGLKRMLESNSGNDN